MFILFLVRFVISIYVKYRYFSLLLFFNKVIFLYVLVGLRLIDDGVKREIIECIEGK